MEFAAAAAKDKAGLGVATAGATCSVVGVGAEAAGASAKPFSSALISLTAGAAGRTGSGLEPLVLDSLLPSFLGAAAWRTWAAVRTEPFMGGVRVGGVIDPARTGNSSAFGTRCWCLNVAGAFLLWCPLRPPLGWCLPPWNLGRFPLSLECDLLDGSVPFFARPDCC